MTRAWRVLARRWRVRREYARLVADRLNRGYNVTSYHDRALRAEAERRVP